MSRAINSHGQQHERENGVDGIIMYGGWVFGGENFQMGLDLNFGACFGVNFTQQQTRHQSSFFRNPSFHGFGTFL